MYPFQSEQLYLTNHWYPAAWSAEVGRHLFERTIMDQPVLFYRREDGRPAAIHGICPHRHLPLACGALVGDEVACGYHGFQFNTEGRCTRIPTQNETPENFRMRSYPLRERAGLIWIWMGDAAQAASSSFPDIDRAGIGTQGWVSAGHVYIQLKARWGLLLDNLFDLSHIGWVHAKSIGAVVDANDEGVANFALAPITVNDQAGNFSVRRMIDAMPVDNFNRFLYPGLSGLINLDAYSDLIGPAVVNAGNASYASPSGELLGNVNFIHMLTPETAHSTHYFGMCTRDFRLDDAGLSAALGAKDNEVRAEDKGVLETIERTVDAFGNTQRELSARVDAGSIRLRRKLDAMLAQEAGLAQTQ